MIIIETPIFTRQLKTILNDEQYRELQRALIASPDRGKVIPGSGGIRKLRWGGSGRGKRGSNRIIYYWFSKQEVILMLFIYSKTEQDNLTAEQLRTLNNLVEQSLNER